MIREEQRECESECRKQYVVNPVRALSGVVSVISFFSNQSLGSEGGSERYRNREIKKESEKIVPLCVCLCVQLCVVCVWRTREREREATDKLQIKILIINSR